MFDVHGDEKNYGPTTGKMSISQSLSTLARECQQRLQLAPQHCEASPFFCAPLRAVVCSDEINANATNLGQLLAHGAKKPVRMCKGIGHLHMMPPQPRFTTVHLTSEHRKSKQSIWTINLAPTVGREWQTKRQKKIHG
jgi:hypothetical protein